MTTRERALDASVEESTAIVRHLFDLPNTEPSSGSPSLHALWTELVRHLEGRGGRRDIAELAGSSPTAEVEAARALTCFDRPLDAFALIIGRDPREHRGILGTALRVVPLVPPDTLFAKRRWLAQLFPALLDSALRDEITPLVHALHARGHFELVDVLRRSKLSEVVPLGSWQLMQATQACWSGRYEEVDSLLAGAALAGSRRVEADLLLAIARGRTASPPTDAEMRSLVERAAHVPGLDESAERWRAELFVRAGRDDTRAVSDVMARASDHVAVRLLYRIIDCDTPPKRPSEDPSWGFHTYVLEALRDAGMDEASAALECEGTPAEEAALWRVLARLGGNRTDYLTFATARGARHADIRTARQESVATQSLLPAVGAEQVRARLARLAAGHPGLSVFVTYQAEILLWEGRYDEAATMFETAVRTAATRWSEVGLGAALAALGREDEAERVWALGHRRHHGALPGEATFIYRAEIAARRGNLQAARELLRGVLTAKPTRTRGWLLRAEIGWLTDEPEEARISLLQALALCPGLARTAAAPPPGLAETLVEARRPVPPARDALIDWCRALRAAMRGNASSWLFTWFDTGGAMRGFRRLPYNDLAQAIETIGRLAKNESMGRSGQR